MDPTTPLQRRRLDQLDRPALEALQLERLNGLLEAILPANRLYADKLAECPGRLDRLDQLQSFPFTYKEDLLSGSDDGLAANLTWPVDRYVRYHQTSGTRGRPLVVLDSADDWPWWLDCWQYVYDAGGVQPADRVLLAFSFGPFIGFWSAHDAAIARGCLVIPTGGFKTLARLELIRSAGATVVCCTPSYALHMAEVAAQRKLDLAGLPVRLLILAGEPGGSIPSIRRQIEHAWQAEVLDHAGATEVGPWGFGDSAASGLHVLETAFIAEFRSLATGAAAAAGELAELVLTSLGRTGSPVIRYRTGDVVRPVWQHDRTCRFVLLEGGVLGRTDDMMIVRGVNVFPAAVERIVRGFPEVAEYRLIVRSAGAMDELTVEVEDRLDQPQRIAEELRLRLGLRVEVHGVPAGSLPRFEGKGRRFIDERKKSNP